MTTSATASRTWPTRATATRTGTRSTTARAPPLEHLTQPRRRVFPGGAPRRGRCVERRRDQEALEVLAPEQLQPLAVRLRLHALRDDLHAEVVRERDDRLDDLARADVGQHRDDQRAVDLQRVAGEAVQEAERRQAGAEVVELGGDAEPGPE